MSDVSFEVSSNTSIVDFEPVSVPTSHVNTVIDEVCVNTIPLEVANKSVNVDLTPLASTEQLGSNTKYILNIIKESQDVSLTEQEINQIFN